MIRQYQYEFSLEIGTLYLEHNPKGPIIISWANKSDSINTKNHYRIQSSGKWCDIGEKLGMKGVCKLNGRVFVSKIFDLKVLVYRNQTHQLYGEFPIDICSILNPNQPTKDSSRTNQEYLKNYTGKVNYCLSAKFIKQVSPMSLDNTTTDFTSTRPMSRQSENSAEFSFQLPSSGRDFRDTRGPSKEKEARSSNDPNLFLQQLDLKRNFDKKKEELGEMQKQLSRAHDRIRGLEGEKQQRNVNLMNEVNILTNQNSELKRQIEHLGQRLNQTRENQQRVEEKNRRIQELEAEGLRKYNQYISTQNRNNAKMKQISTFNERMHEQNKLLSVELQKSNERLTEIERMKDQQMTHYSKEKRDLEAVIKSKEDKCKEKQMSLQKVRLEFENSNLQRGNILMKERDYKGKIEQQEGVIKRLEGENEAIKGIVKQVEEEYKQFKSKLESKKDEYLTKISVLESENAKKQSQLQDRDQLIHKAKLFIEQKDDEILQRNNFIHQAKQYVQSKEAQLKQALGEVERYRQELSHGSKESSTLILKLKQQNISLKQRLRVSLQQGDALRQQMQVKEKFLSQYLSDLAAQKQLTLQLQKQIESLLEELRQQREESMAKQEQLKVGLSDLVKQNVEYKLEMTKAQNQLKRVNYNYESRFQ